MHGKFIWGSGQEWAMSAAEIFTCGMACSILDEHYIKRTRYAHQVHWWHCLLKQEAYMAYCTEIDGSPETFEQWGNIRTGNIPMFQYWTKII